MRQKHAILWFSAAGVIGALFGIVYAFFGLAILPVSKDVLGPWSNGVYGATLIGLSVTMFFVGRHAFRENDTALMKALLYGVCAWLTVEAIFSLYYRVFFNVGVDVALLVLLGVPLARGARR